MLGDRTRRTDTIEKIGLPSWVCAALLALTRLDLLADLLRPWHEHASGDDSDLAQDVGRQREQGLRHDIRRRQQLPQREYDDQDEGPLHQ